MEGWDGTPDGEPSDLTRRRWRNFGISGAKLIWGGEAVAVRADGRANPNQLLITRATPCRRSRACARRWWTRTASASAPNADADLSSACSSRTPAASRGPNVKDRAGAADRLRPSRPRPPLPARRPRAQRRRPRPRWSRTSCAPRGCAQAAGFRFVDVKHCHGYLGHELLVRARPRRAATAAASRTARASCARSSTASAPRPRASASACACPCFDTVPWRKDADGVRRCPRPSRAGYHSRLRPARGRATSTRPSTTRRALLPPARGARRALGLRHRGQPLLQPARAASGAVPAHRRLPAAGGSAARRGAPDRGHRAPQGRVPEPRDRGLGLQLPAGVAAPRGPDACCAGPGRLRRPRAHGPVLSRAARRRARRARRCGARRSAAPSATAPRRRATGLVSGCYPARPLLRRAIPTRSTCARPRRRCPHEHGPDVAPRPCQRSVRRRRPGRWPWPPAFLALFSIVGFALYGLPFFYDFFVKDLGWTRQQVTSGNALQQARWSARCSASWPA